MPTEPKRKGMKTKRRIRSGLLALLAIFFFLFTALIIHIAKAPSLEVDNATMQIARIDFRQPLSTEGAKEMHRQLRAIPGVSHDKYFADKGVLVYWLDNRVTDSRRVFDQLMAKGDYDAQRFTVPEHLAQQRVCPAMDPNSFKYRFSVAVQRIFR